MTYVFICVAAALTASWGAMHLAKTGPVVAGFEPLSEDNRHVLRMEWIIEGVALLFVAALVCVITISQGPAAIGSKVVYRMSALLLLALAGVSLFTGAKASPLPYKLCAPIFSTAATLLLIASFWTDSDSG